MSWKERKKLKETESLHGKKIIRNLSVGRGKGGEEKENNGERSPAEQ